ncbi:hypothetical protein [Planctobacterium marinum]|uniref:hypothetical protein n=1 Tax=Planctobacterium marinum TaxID=1631968 RepID=UPI001E5C1437|nr:hypothetical protein [Planctobacterium marinum]MCC2607342.1 hypothetical protein [Planctobacterium marinum]
MTSNSQNNLLGADSANREENIMRLLSQTKAVLETLTVNDQYSCISHATLGSNIWLVEDQIKQIESEFTELLNEKNKLND